MQNPGKGRIMPPRMVKRLCAVLLAGMMLLPLGGCSGLGSLIGGISQLVGVAAQLAMTLAGPALAYYLYNRSDKN